jgi:hypothetical protein
VRPSDQTLALDGQAVVTANAQQALAMDGGCRTNRLVRPAGLN